MHVYTLFILAVGLSMDAFAVAIHSGLLLRPLHKGKLMKLAFFFGGFQAAMPLLGWLAGVALRDVIASVDHWIAFGLLSLIGAKMIYEGFQDKDEGGMTDPFATKTLLMLAIATSIDALAVGVSLSFYAVSIVLAACIIGCTTFTISVAGVLIGNRIGHFFEKGAEIFGGLILILIGISMLF